MGQRCRVLSGAHTQLTLVRKRSRLWAADKTDRRPHEAKGTDERPRSHSTGPFFVSVDLDQVAFHG